MVSFIVTSLSFLAIYFGWLCFVFIFFCPWLIKKKYYRKTNTALLILSLLFLWAHYIEPQLILTKEKTIHHMGFNADVILISDLHLGLYKDHHYLKRIVNKINHISADYVVIAGDFIYKDDPKNYIKLFKPLSKINKPVYAVRGNHDYPKSRNQLLKTLKKYQINFIENNVVDLNNHQLVGLGDRLKASDNANFLHTANKTKPILALAHNPDSSDQLTSFNTSLLMAGHTHCGQVYLPFITNKLVIKSQYNFTCGFYNATHQTVPVFITPGVGENNLPLRLLTPPTINILHLRK